MGTKYSGNSTSGYNSTPPSDDGTVSEANKVKYSTIKTKLTDPVKTLAETIDSELTTHFDHGPTALTSNTTLDSSHYEKFIQVSSAGVTLTLTDAAALGAGWNCWIRNTDSSNSVTIGRATGADTFNGSASNYNLRPGDAIHVFVNAAANGFFTANWALGNAQTIGGKITAAGGIDMSSTAINFAEGSDVASAATCDIWSTTGNTVHVTGTTTITSFGTAPQAGASRWVIFDGALTLTHAANLNLPGSANITTAAGDFAYIYADTTAQFDVVYFKANGQPVAPVGANVQEFTSTGAGTWTKPTGYAASSPVLVQIWSAGGSGAFRTGTGGGGGGGGGAFREFWCLLSALGATETATVGAGGAAVSGSNANGNNGGSSSFTLTPTSKTITIPGGSGGVGAAAGANANGGDGADVYDIATGTLAFDGGVGSNTAGPPSIDGGGAGGGINAGSAAGLTGGNSRRGGAGGGSAGSGPTTTAGGSSELGGAGGAGASDTGTGVSGSAPGGGGGGARNGCTASGAGGNGKIRVTVFSVNS